MIYHRQSDSRIVPEKRTNKGACACGVCGGKAADQGEFVQANKARTQRRK